MALGNTSYVILGMLHKGPKSGYEIKAKADVSTRFFWAISYGQIYPELKRLEQDGLIEGEADAGNGRQRRVFSITASGEKALREWLRRPGDLHSELRHEGVLRLFFADALDREERLELLSQIRTKHAQLREELAGIEPAATALAEETGDAMPLLTLETGIAYQQFFVDQCDRLERRLAETESTIGGS
ncbi:MAG TPA: PadR family transcriptional regulator [Thermoleophilaceae bacterium]|nr:PadR family transcriptional regulator [Thermoleophilaceae bacterium]